ncbi:hypothetical protein NHQ30_004301 [Ciborinia camelliae]|nr:hypothetical protein NHQ30_004301 [Ciborinia camelliae]
MATSLKFFPQSREPFGQVAVIMVRLGPLDEFRLRNVRKDIYGPRIHNNKIPQLEIIRQLGTSNITFIRQTLSKIARKQSRFKIALTSPFLVDRSTTFSLHMLAYAPELKSMRTRIRDVLKDIVTVGNQDKNPFYGIEFSTVGAYHWPNDTKILLKSHIPAEEGDSWLDHAKEQCHRRLNPVTATGLTLITFNNYYRVKRHDKRGTVLARVPIKYLLDSEIVYEEYPFEGNEAIQPFDASTRI